MGNICGGKQTSSLENIDESKKDGNKKNDHNLPSED